MTEWHGEHVGAPRFGEAARASSDETLRVKSNFPRPFNLICPVQFFSKKFSTLPVGQIISTSPRRLASIRGTFRDRHERWARDAVDAFVRQTNARQRTVKPCGSDVSTLTSSFATMLRIALDDGDKKARSPGRAWNKP